MLQRTLLFTLLLFHIIAAALPRYSPALLEGSVGGGVYGLKINGDYFSPEKKETAGYFCIGGAINPFGFFLPDNKPVPLHYFDVFVNVGLNIIGQSVLWDTSYVLTENRILEVTYQPFSFNIGSNLKFGLLPFLDLSGGVGINIGNERLLFQESMVLSNGNTFTNDSTVKSHPKTSFYIDFGFDAFLPKVPFAKLGVYFRKDFRSSSFEDYYENDVRPANFSTDMSNSGLSFRAVATFSLRGESKFRIRQRTASTNFDKYIASLPTRINRANIDDLKVLSDSLDYKYDKIVLKENYTLNYKKSSRDLKDEIHILHKKFSSDSISAFQSLKARYSFYSKYRNSQSYSSDVSRIARFFTKKDYENAQLSESPDVYRGFISAYSGISGVDDGLLSLATKQMDSLTIVSEVVQWKTTHASDLNRIRQLTKRIKSNLQELSPLESVSKKYQTYRIVGKISNLTGSRAQIWGVAVPDKGLEGYNPGAVLDEGNIIVNNIDKSGLRGGNMYVGHHCYKDKTYGESLYIPGQRVEVFIFGQCSTKKTSADRQISYLEAQIEDLENEIKSIKKKIGYYEAVKKLESIE